MITIYTYSKNQKTCIQAKEYLNKRDIPCNVVEFSRMFHSDFIELLSATNDGVTEILKVRGKYALSVEELDMMTINMLIDFLLKHPLALKSPLVLGSGRLHVGFNEREMRLFIPKVLRHNNLRKRVL